jgi:hypothetical protein
MNKIKIKNSTWFYIIVWIQIYHDYFNVKLNYSGKAILSWHNLNVRPIFIIRKTIISENWLNDVEYGKINRIYLKWFNKLYLSCII